MQLWDDTIPKRNTLYLRFSEPKFCAMSNGQLHKIAFWVIFIGIFTFLSCLGILTMRSERDNSITSHYSVRSSLCEVRFAAAWVTKVKVFAPWFFLLLLRCGGIRVYQGVVFGRGSSTHPYDVRFVLNIHQYTGLKYCASKFLWLYWSIRYFVSLVRSLHFGGSGFLILFTVHIRQYSLQKTKLWLVFSRFLIDNVAS